MSTGLRAGRGFAPPAEALWFLRCWVLALGDAAGQFLDLLFLGAARFGLLGLGGGLLAGGALELLSFLGVFDLGGVCHL